VGWLLRRPGNSAARPVAVLSLAVLAIVAFVAIVIGDAVAN
jgi:hypothetical protein